MEDPLFDTSKVDELAAAEYVNAETQPETLEDLFHELNSLSWQLADECKEIDEIIADMEEKRAEKADEYAPRIQELNEQIKAEILKNGKSFKCEWGSATYRKGRTTITWNDDALMGYAVDHPEILKFRTVKTGEPSVSLKIGDLK